MLYIEGAVVEGPRRRRRGRSRKGQESVQKGPQQKGPRRCGKGQKGVERAVVEYLQQVPDQHPKVQNLMNKSQDDSNGKNQKKQQRQQKQKLIDFSRFPVIVTRKSSDPRVPLPQKSLQKKPYFVKNILNIFWGVAQGQRYFRFMKKPELENLMLVSL